MKNTYTVLKSRKVVETNYNLFIVMAEVIVESSYRKWPWPFKKVTDFKKLWLPLNDFGNVVFSFGVSFDSPRPAKFSTLDNALRWLEGTGIVYPRDAVFIDDIGSWKYHN